MENTTTNPFASKSDSWKESMEILNDFDGCLEATQEYFEYWINNSFDGDFDEFLASGLIETTETEAFSEPMPFVQSQFGNHIYNVQLQKWQEEGDFADFESEMKAE